MSRLERLREAGVSIWLDTLSRELLDSGAFARLMADCAVTGATSNPTIFAKAITGSDRYDDQFRAAVAAGVVLPADSAPTPAGPRRRCAAPRTAQPPHRTPESAVDTLRRWETHGAP